MKKRSLVIMMLFCLILLALLGCSGNMEPAEQPELAAEGGEEGAESTWEDVFAEQIRERIRTEEDENVIGDLDEMKFIFMKVVPGNFTGFEQKEILVQVDAESYKRIAFHVAAIFDCETMELKGQKLLFPENVALYGLPVDEGVDRILYLGESVDMGLNRSTSILWKIEDGEWKKLSLPEIPEYDFEIGKNISVEYNKKGQLMVMDERIEHGCINTGDFTIKLYRWEPAIGEFVPYR